jgi:hypothetical protein
VSLFNKFDEEEMIGISFSMTSSTKSSSGKFLGISGNEETENPVPTMGIRIPFVFFLSNYLWPDYF